MLNCFWTHRHHWLCFAAQTRQLSARIQELRDVVQLLGGGTSSSPQKSPFVDAPRTAAADTDNESWADYTVRMETAAVVCTQKFAQVCVWP